MVFQKFIRGKYFEHEEIEMGSIETNRKGISTGAHEGRSRAHFWQSCASYLEIPKICLVSDINKEDTAQ